ncbi:MAG: polyprenol monophosphomannose synthase [Chloroflexota bacterium]|nr:polyprenol monophosphomannose synthase [Chloroflexota bacterium]
MKNYMQNPWVVIPTYNEAGNVAALANALLALAVPTLQVLFVDDDSPDGTGELLEELTQRFPGRVHALHRTGPRGLGRAYIDGFRHVLAKGATALVQMDADFSHQPQEVPHLFAALETADLVVGSRYVAGGSIDPTWAVQRRMLSSGGNLYARLVLGLRAVQDATGGFRAWRRETLWGIGLERIHSQGYIFQVETTYVAHRLGYKIVEIPIFFPDRQVGESKMDLKIKVEATLRVWDVWRRHRRLTLQDRLTESP